MAPIDFELKVLSFTERHGMTLLRLSIGFIFLWFGVLKFFPGLSPAEGIASRTLGTITLGLLAPGVALFVLAAWECLIGAGTIFNKYMRFTLFLLFLQMAGTMLPLLLFPGDVFSVFPFAPTLEGQYILKNLVIISAGIVIASTAAGGAVIADPEIAKKARKAEARKYKL